MDDGFCLCEIILDADGKPNDYKFLEVNRHFAEVSGLQDAAGRTIRELVPGFEDHWVQIYARVALDREPVRFQNTSESLGRSFDVYAAPAEPHGRFTVVFRDVTGLRKAESEREAALSEARQLLAELNHRVKNSLGIIAAIVSMEARGRSDGEGRQALARIGSRVQAVATLYDQLVGSPSVHAVDASEYLARVVDGLSHSIGATGDVRLTSDIASLYLPTRIAVPLGLIVNELATNSLKYAFPDGRRGTVSVVLAHDGGMCDLTVADDGQGLPAHGNGPVTGLGQRLVDAFVQTIEGERRTETGPHGTRITIRFPAG